jgi:hypothetical protein
MSRIRHILLTTLNLMNYSSIPGLDDILAPKSARISDNRENPLVDRVRSMNIVILNNITDI